MHEAFSAPLKALKWEDNNISVCLVHLWFHDQSVERFRFWDKDDYESEILPMLSSTRVQSNVILAGKSDSHCHSTTSVSENVAAEKTSYQLNVRNFII